MKICWDNLEKLKYKQDKGGWFNKTSVLYKYKESCKNCGDPFLAHIQSQGLYCDHLCVNGSRIFSEETKQKMSESAKKRLKIPENNPRWKGGYRKNNIPMFDTYAHQISYCEEIKRNEKDQNILEVKCAYCGKWFIPTRGSINNRVQSLNNQIGECRLYCSIQCKQECPIYNQNKWPKGFKLITSREVQPELRQMCFERDNYTCQRCGKTQDELETGLHCHHIEGIRWEPLESADLDKVITFCKDCHIEVHKQIDCGYQDMRCK